MEWAAKGTAALAGTDQAPQAAAYFTKALIENPTSPDYFTQRATAFSRFRPARHDLALQDAEYAVLLGQKRARREKIQAAQQRRVVALYGLDRAADAKYILDSMLKWRKKEDKKDKMEHDMWMAKINNKLKGSETDSHTVKEVPEIELPNEKTLKQWLQSQISKDGLFQEHDIADTSTTALQPEAPSDVGLSETELAAAKAELPRPASVVQPVRHDFYQNNDSVIVTFYAKKVDPKMFNCNIQSNSVQLTFPHPDDPTTLFSYSANPTHAQIEPSKSVFKVFGTKIELNLAKADKGAKWPALQATEQEALPAKLPNPYVMKNKDDIDWEKKAAKITKKPEKPKKKKNDKITSDDMAQTHPSHEDEEQANDSDDSEFGGGDPVDSFFKQLYSRSDEDTKRAMMKSFQESNGTALSTNWADVGKARVEEVKSKKDE